jgi:hypothetical protein
MMFAAHHQNIEAAAETIPRAVTSRCALSK